MQIHSIESLAALDGEGLRYELFLRGCPLRCICCHNPDTWNMNVGKQMSCEELLNKIIRYVPYFGDDGGVTFSGGEPLLQAGEIAKLGKMLKEHNIGYTIDTSGAIPLTDEVKQAVKGADTIICDLKYPDNQSMMKYTSGDLKQVIDFLDYLKEEKKQVWIRTVIIPDINDNFLWLDKYIETLMPYKSIIKKYELLAFHTMGFFKYENLGIENPLKDTKPLELERLKQFQQYVDEKIG